MTRLLFLIAIAIVISLTPSTVSAQSYDWECSWDFTTSAGWQATLGDRAQYIASTGWRRSVSSPNRLQIEATFTYTGTLNYVAVDFSRTLVLSAGGFVNYDGLGTNVFSAGQTLDDFVNTTSINYSGGRFNLRMHNATSPGSTTPFPNDLYVQSIVLRGLGTTPSNAGCTSHTAPTTLVNPLNASDRAPITDIFQSLGLAGGISSRDGAFVLASLAGTITDIKNISADCALSTNPDCVFFNATTGNNLSTLIQNVNPNMYQVTLTTASGDIKYFVTNATNYITEGMTVEEGCYVGQTAPAPLSLLGPLGSIGSALYSPGYYAVKNDTGLTFEREATGRACNAPEPYASCLGDAQLAVDSAWQQNRASITNGLAVIEDGGYIATTMLLQSSQQPELRVGVQVRDDGIRSVAPVINLGLSNVELQLGTTTSTATVTDSTSYTEVTISAAAHTSDLGNNLYTVRISNPNLGKTMRVAYVCTRFTYADDGTTPLDPLPEPELPVDEWIPVPGGPNAPTHFCTFANHSFEFSSVWDFGSTTKLPGEVGFRHNQSITQNLTLQTRTYYLTLVFAVWDYGNYTPDATNTDSVDFLYAFNGGGLQPVAETTYGELATKNNLMTVTAPISITAGTGIFQINLQSDTLPAGVQGIALRSACLAKTGSVTGVDGGENEGGLFEATCTITNSPALSAGVGSWTSWLWVKLNGFFQCDLMILLNSMYDVMHSSYRLFAWSLLYNQASVAQTVNWFSSNFLPYLDGHLSNLANGRVVNITSEAGCNNIFCLLESVLGFFDSIIAQISDLIDPIIALLTDITSRIFDIIDGVLTLGLELITLFVSVVIGFATLGLELIQIAVNVITSVIIGYYNATPTPIPGVPNCATFNENPVCVGIWIIDNTVFSGIGANLIPAFVSIASIHMLLWVYSEIRRTIITIGASS